MRTELEAGRGVTRRFVEQEHRELAGGIAAIDEVAARIEPTAAAEVPHQVRVLLDWFTRRFEQHLAWEDAWLYPQLDELAGTRWVTRLMRFEHDQIRGAFNRLESEWQALGPDADRHQLAALRGHLYGLACVIRAHLEREEWILVPLLEEA